MDIKENVALASYTVFKIGGPAKYFYEAKNKHELVRALKWAEEKNLPFFVLGAGSNVLISDDGFPGLVIKMGLQGITASDTHITAEAGVSMARVVNFAVERGLGGFEWGIGVPGTIGGSLYGNAGCYGSEMKDVVESVQVLQLPEAHISPDLAQSRHGGTSRAIREHANMRVWENVVLKEDCRFSYRNSIFKKHPGWIILGATIKLQTADPKESRAKILEYTKKRTTTQGIGEKCAGCIFKNPKADLAAAYLIDKTGLKGKKIGAATVSQKHANYIVNTGGATARDVKGLIGVIKNEVKKVYGILLEEEIRIV